MASNRWLDGLNEETSKLDELQGGQFEDNEVSVTTYTSPLIPILAILAIALASLGVLVLLVLCCRRCCRSERGRVLVAPPPVTPQPQVVTQFITTPRAVSLTPTRLQLPQLAATHAEGAYSDSNKPSRHAYYPPAYDQDQIPLLN